MALQIINAGPGPEKIVQQIREAIAEALPDARAEVVCASPGHFEIQVSSRAFEGKSRVQQHQQTGGHRKRDVAVCVDRTEALIDSA